MIWFTADTHAWHGNIIRYCNRPWETAQEMTEALARNINSVVRPNDVLYHLGDFAWGNKMWIEGFRSMINCHQIHLILGNHDKLIRDDKVLQRLFSKTSVIQELHRPSCSKIVMCHYAMRVWNASFHGSWHLYGHSHGTLPDNVVQVDDGYKRNAFDVGVDCWDYKPISLDQVIDRMNNVQRND
jgi:calcineurin-like phosphoesterase family protein